MLRSGFSRNFIPEEDEFQEFAFVYHIALVAAQFCMARYVAFLSGGYEFLDLDMIKISEMSFRGVMGLLAAMMVSPYLMSLFVRSYYKAIGYSSSYRAYEELAMVIGSLSVVFFSLHLFGLWGLVLLPVSPPILVSVLLIAVMKH